MILIRFTSREAMLQYLLAESLQSRDGQPCSTLILDRKESYEDHIDPRRAED